MNFFTALAIFHILMPEVDISPLPLLATTYQIDSTSILPSDQEIWQVKAPGVLENILLKPNSSRTKVDTTRSYIHMNSSNNPIRLTALPQENPIQNGAEFIFTGALLSKRYQYENGKKVFTTEYQFTGDNLSRRITWDSLGPVDTTEFAYQDGKISSIESHLRSGFLKTKYSYRGADTIESREYDINGSASSIRIFWILKDGNIQKQNTYNNGKLTHQTLFEKIAVTAVQDPRVKPSQSSPIRDSHHQAAFIPLFGSSPQEPHDALGRNLRNK